MARNKKSKKWLKPIMYNNKKCYHITDINKAFRKKETKFEYNRYRAILNVLIGGATKKKVPFSGDIGEVITENDLKRLKNITHLIVGQKEILIRKESKGKSNYQTYQLTDLQTFETEVLKELKLPVKEKIKGLEKESYEAHAKEIYLGALAYKEIHENKTLTAQNEKKGSIDVVSSYKRFFPKLKCFIITTHDFTQPKIDRDTVLKNTKMFFNTNPREQTLFKNIFLGKGKESFYKEKERVEHELDKLKDKLEFVGYAHINFYSLKLLVKRFSEISDLDKTLVEYLETEIKMDNYISNNKYSNNSLDETLSEQEKILQFKEQAKNEIEKKLLGINSKILPYIEFQTLGQKYIDLTNATEVKRWLRFYEKSETKKIIKRELQKKNKFESLHIRAIYDFLNELGFSEEILNPIIFIYNYTPKEINSTSKAETMGYSLENKEEVKKIAREMVKIDKWVDELIKTLNGLHHFVFVAYMLKYSVEGIEYTEAMVDKLMYDFENPFIYTRPLIEKVNTIMMAEHPTDKRYEKATYKAFNFVNPNSLNESWSKPPEYLTKQIGKIFSQYKQYISKA